MKIDRVETFIAHNWGFVRLRTDTGISGIGASTFFGFPEAGTVAAQPFAPKLCVQEHHGMRHSDQLRDLVDRTAAIREAASWDIDPGIELHRNMVSRESTALIRELKQFRPLFVEDPIVPDRVLSFGEVSAKTSVPMAAGERNTTIWEFREYVEHGGLHHIRPDAGIAGGIIHVKKICALAEAYHQGVIPHAVPSGPVATAAQVQLGACVPNWEVQEHREQDKAPWSSVVDAVIPVRNGFFDIPETPGPGIALDDAVLATVPVLPPASKTARCENCGIAFR